MKGDHRNYLYVQYAKYLKIYKAKMFVFENVIGLKSAGAGKYLENMEKLLDRKGYYMRLYTVEANNFGVLQNRKRIIIIGWKKELQPILPELERIRNNEKHTVRELLTDLPSILAGEGDDKYSIYRKEATAYLQDKGIRNGIDVLTQHVARPHTIKEKKISRIAVKLMKEKKELN